MVGTWKPSVGPNLVAVLMAHPLPSHPPSKESVREEAHENHQGSSALSPAFISENPFGKMKGRSCWKQRRGTWYMVPKGKGKTSLWCGQPQTQNDRCWQISILNHRQTDLGSSGSLWWAEGRGALSKPQPPISSQPLGTGARARQHLQAPSVAVSTWASYFQICVPHSLLNRE